MKTKLFALLTALSLVSAPAFSEIDLTPYELPSEYGSSVQVISPALTLVLTDKSHGRNNENTLPTSITLYDEGKIGLQIEFRTTQRTARASCMIFSPPAPPDMG